MWVLAILNALAGPPSSGWETLSSGETSISCTRAGPEPWCRATGTIAAPVDRVWALLDDIGGHARMYSRIELSVEFEPGYAHQVIALPYPLEDRDYLVRLTRSTRGETRVITFTSVSRPDVPAQGLRLDHFAGEFELRPLPDGRTSLTYTWQGELGPDVPDWALPLAWRAQGSELVDGLREAAERGM